MEAASNDNATALVFTQQWEVKPTDLSNCTVCEDIIFTDMHIPYYVCGDIRADINYRLCEHCFNELNDK
jgi:hypothetical protein